MKNGDHRIQLIQHLQNVVAPNIFHPRIVYDGRALAYSPGRPLPLAAGTGETVSLLFPLPASLHSPSTRTHSIESRSPSPFVHISPPVATSILSDLSPEEVPLRRQAASTNFTLKLRYNHWHLTATTNHLFSTTISTISTLFDLFTRFQPVPTRFYLFPNPFYSLSIKFIHCEPVLLVLKPHCPFSAYTTYISLATLFSPISDPL